MQNQVFLKNILLKINLLKWNILTRKWTFFYIKPQRDKNVPLLIMLDYSIVGGIFGKFGDSYYYKLVLYDLQEQPRFQTAFCGTRKLVIIEP